MNQRIGGYVVEREIGRGGMGVVYLARDDRLDRLVAIKTLPEDLATDPMRLDRFEREGKSLAQLNHTNIAGIYGIEEQDGQKYLILEYVEGDTLGDRLDAGRMPVDEAIELAIGIATGLEAAHDVGVIHRDLKPDNIKITPNGVVKVLDFGLAKADGTASTTNLANSPTVTSPRSPTIPGVILGTAAYMSPEQARGRHVDKRTDIWSFGVLLYEMLTGIGPFVGESANDSIGAVLHKDIDLDRLPPGTPSGVRRVISRCVERDKSLRFRDIGDVRVELIRAQHEPDETMAGAAHGTGIRHVALLVLLLPIVAVGGFLAAQAVRPSVEKRVARFDLVVETEDSSLRHAEPKISPDGSRVAFIQDDMIHIRELALLESRALPGTDGADDVHWSPDGRWIAYHTKRAVYKIAANAGSPIKLSGDMNGFEGAIGGGWTADDRIVISYGDEGLVSIPASGGERTTILPLNSERMVDFHDPAVIPGTSTVLYVQHNKDNSFVVKAFDGSREAVISAVSDSIPSHPTWSPSGHVLFSRGPIEWSVWAIEFDLDQMAVKGNPLLVESHGWQPSVSSDGTLVYLQGAFENRGNLAWVDRNGNVEPIDGDFDMLYAPILSPDGSRVAFSAGQALSFDIWIHDFARHTNSRITFDEGILVASGWSPDGREIAVMYLSSGSGVTNETKFYYLDGSGESRPPITGHIKSFVADWSSCVMTRSPMSNDATHYAIRLDEPENAIEMQISGTSGPRTTALSPDGSLMLYTSNESGTNQVFCTRFPDGTGKWQISTHGGMNPRWSSDGTRIYFGVSDIENQLFEVEVTQEPALRFGMPVEIFTTGGADIDLQGDWYPSADGQRFVYVKRTSDEGQGRAAITVVQNWFEEHHDQ